MLITKISLSRTKVHVEYVKEGETFKVDSPDRPLPSFLDTMRSLPAIAIRICGLSKTYAGKPHPDDLSKTKNALRVTGVTLTEKQGARRVVLECKKVLPDADLQFVFNTPARFMEHPEEEGTYSAPLSDEDAEVIEEMIEEARKFACHERAQGQLPFPEDNDGDDSNEPAEPTDGTATLPFPEGGTGTPVKPKQAKKA